MQKDSAQEEDRDAIARTLAGETDAFAELVARYQQRVRAYCLNMLGSPLESEDAAQEVFLRAFRGLSTFRSDASFSTWLFAIAVNHCRDRLRRAASRRTEPLELQEERGELQKRADQSASLIAKDLLQVLFRDLKQEYQEVLLLREYHQRSYSEIAEIMEVSMDSVKARLRRARVELAKKLKVLEERAQTLSSKGLSTEDSKLKLGSIEQRPSEGESC